MAERIAGLVARANPNQESFVAILKALKQLLCCNSKGVFFSKSSFQGFQRTTVALFLIQSRPIPVELDPERGTRHMRERIPWL